LQEYARITVRGAVVAIDDKIDMPLEVQADILGSVLGNPGKATPLKYFFQMERIGCGKLNEFKSVQSHGIFKKIGHVAPRHYNLSNWKQYYPDGTLYPSRIHDFRRMK
jgi:hypothetical protein